ncbi:MAG: metal-dependent hydrolase [Halovenus sp.]
MWPPGHLAVGYLVYAFGSHRRGEIPTKGPAVVVAVASLLPDLVDKPLAWYLGVLPTGRSLAHSLVVLVPVALAVVLLARRGGRGREGVAFAVGVFTHVAADALPILWKGDASGDFLLWPLRSVDPGPEGTPDPVDLLLTQAGEPYFLLEFVLLAVALAWWRRDRYPGLTVLTQAVRRE